MDTFIAILRKQKAMIRRGRPRFAPAWDALQMAWEENKFCIYNSMYHISKRARRTVGSPVTRVHYRYLRALLSRLREADNAKINASSLC